jgi:hypothetical protein
MVAVAAFALAIGNVQAGSYAEMDKTKNLRPDLFKAITAQGGPSFQQTLAAVKYFIQRTFKDPYSVQDLRIGVPFWNTKGTTLKDWVILFECNAKNGFGGYTGIQTHALMWKNGWIDQGATVDYYQWQAFLEGMRQGLQ